MIIFISHLDTNKSFNEHSTLAMEKHTKQKTNGKLEKSSFLKVHHVK